MGSQPIKLGVDCRALVRPRSGIRSYLEGMLGALSRRDDVTRLALYTDFPDHLDYPWMDGRHEQVHVPLPGISRQSGRNPLSPLWLHIRLPRYVRKGAIDVFWTPEWALPISLAVPGIITVHDLIPLETPMRSHPPLWRLYYRLSLAHSVRQAHRVVVDSESTGGKVTQVLGVPPEKVVVIPLGIDHRWQTAVPAATVAAVRQKHGIDGNLLLTVGELSDRKNAAVLIEAMGALPPHLRETTHLVVVGPDGCDAGRVRQLTHRNGLTNRVHFVGYVEDNELPAYYAAATVFLFPSLAEGFGLPPLEAMAAGVPVVCSNAPCLPETVGNAALLIPPHDAQAWADGITALFTTPGLRDRAVALGLEHVRQFDWSTAAAKLGAVFTAAVSRS